MSGWCWSRPAGGCRDRPPARTLRGAGGARPLVAAGDAGGPAHAPALARLGRIERTLRQRREHRLRARAAALRRHRHRDPGRIGGHAGRCGARALHRAGAALGEPQVRGFRGRLGRTARRFRRCRTRCRCRTPRRCDGAHGRAQGCAARAWRLAQAACGRAALHAFRLPGVRHRLPGGCAGARRGDGAGRLPPGARRHARLGRRPCAAAGAGRAAVARGRAGRSRHGRRTRRGHEAARSGAGRRAIPSTNSASRRAARSRSRRRASPSTIRMGPTLPSGCCRPSPSPRSGRAGAATR